MLATLLIGANTNGRLSRRYSCELVRAGHCLQLTFEDNFQDLKLAGPWRRGWLTRYSQNSDLDARTLRNNRELQIYVDQDISATIDAPATVTIEDGILRLTALPTPPALQSAVWDYPYVSGMLNSREFFSQRYGYFEIRARLPGGAGLWPAFWLLPVNGDWPPEIDILEALGENTETYYTSLHYRTNGAHRSHTQQIPTPDLSEAFHTFGVLWTDQQLIWFFDGVEVAHRSATQDLHTAMYMIVNLAVGGVWAGLPDSQTPFPATYEIDYIRAYSFARFDP